MINEQINETYAILDRAVEAYNPSTIIACYSGGYDSMVMSHLALRWAKDHGLGLIVIPVDTLISADGWREFVTASAEQIGADRFEIWNNPDLDKWVEDVKTRGFVYRRHQHHIYFYYLKQRVFRAIQAHYKKHIHDRIMFLNGIRRAESKERLKSPEVEERGAGVFVNPVLYWQNHEIDAYRVQHDLPINPFYDLFTNSGDCLCNWHNHISLQAVVRHAPEAAKIIVPLDTYNRKNFGYGYDEEDRGRTQRQREAEGQLPMFDWDTECTPNLCAGCQRPEPSNDMRDFAALQRMEWDEE